MPFTDLIFDLYGTLVDIHTEEDESVWEHTAYFFGFYGAHYTGPELKTAFAAAMRFREAAAGQNYECFPDIPCETVFTELFRDKGITELADELGFQASQLFRILSIEYIRLYPQVREALAILRQKGFRLWLLSNAQRAFTAYELQLLDLWKEFDGVYLSSDYRCRKPDSRFYQALLKDHALDPKDCLMIGNDQDTDIAGAKALGMTTLYMHTNLTPAHQAEANPDLDPGTAPKGTLHWEFEGYDWIELTRRILNLA